MSRTMSEAVSPQMRGLRLGAAVNVERLRDRSLQPARQSLACQLRLGQNPVIPIPGTEALRL